MGLEFLVRGGVHTCRRLGEHSRLSGGVARPPPPELHQLFSALAGDGRFTCEFVRDAAWCYTGIFR